jgi:hypothetical protein
VAAVGHTNLIAHDDIDHHLHLQHARIRAGVCVSMETVLNQHRFHHGQLNALFQVNLLGLIKASMVTIKITVNQKPTRQKPLNL